MMHSRRTARSVSHLACVLVLLVLAACGGGGGGKANLVATQPQEKVEAQARRAAILAEVDQIEQPTEQASTELTAEEWEGMKSELKTALAAQNPEKLIAGVPDEELNKITDYTVTANEDGSATFRWRYRNLGDYNQNSTVGYTDLASLAFYFHGGLVDLPEEEPIDGDLNTELNSQDIVPIAMYWDNTITGYVLLVAPSPDAPEDEWTSVATIPFSVGVLPEDRSWLIFEYTLENPADGQYYTIAPFYLDETGKGVTSSAVLFESDATGRPQNVKASQGTVADSVELTWDEMPLALFYEIRRSTEVDGYYSTLGETEPYTAAYTDTEITQGVHYWYKVRAWLPGGLSKFSNPVEGWPLNTPDAPLALLASHGDYTDRVALSWQASDLAVDYQIHRRSVVGGSYSAIDQTTQTLFNDLSAEPGQEYYYTVVARNTAGSSEPSNEALGLRMSGTAPTVLRVYPFEGTTGEPLEPVALLRGGQPTSWSWNFGGGGQPDITISQNPYLVLGEPGLYPSTLSVANPAGSDTYDFVLDVRPANTAPTVEDVYPQNGTEQTVVSFSVTTTGGLPTSYSWNFGGGARPPITIASSPTVTLGDPGTYSAAVTVANPFGQDVYFFTLNVGSTPTAPAPPQNLIASDGDFEDRISLNWSPSAGALGYLVYRDTLSTEIANVSGTASYVDTSVDDYLAHTYWVAAYNDIGTGSLSTGDDGYRGLPVPQVITASDGTFANLIRVSWVSSVGADGYYVYRDSGTDLVADLATTNWDDTNAGSYEEHSYYVRPYNTDQTGESSPTDTGFYGLAMPSGLSASDGAFTDYVQLQWNEVNGAANYEIYRDSNSGLPIATVGVELTYDDYVTDLSEHTYWVRAVNSLATGSMSTSDTGYRGLTAPNNLTASDGTYGSYVRLAWDGVTGASGYKVYRDSQDTPIQTLGAVTTWDDPVSDYNQHTYWVRATYVLGDGAFSESDTGFKALAAPNTVTASDGLYEDKVAVSWSNVASASRYNVYRGPTLVGDGVIGTTFDDTPADYASYTYSVSAVKDGAGESSLSASDTGYRGLPAPTSVTASDGTYTNKVAVTWSAVSGASGYNVYRGSTLVGDGVTGTSLDDTPTDYATYTYSVHAIHGGARPSALTGSDTGYRGLSAPTTVTASDGTYTNRVAVSWTTVSGAASYNVYRDSTLVGNQLLGTVYDDTVVPDYNQHTYAVHAVNSTGSESPISGTDTGYRGLPAVTNVNASDGEYTDKVNIIWDVIIGAASYNVYRDSTQIGVNVPVNSLDDTTVADYTLHTYKVYAAPASGPASALYGEDTGYRGLVAPGNVSASDGLFGDRVEVTWDNVAGATGFNVYRSGTLVGDNVQYASLPLQDTPSDYAQYVYQVYALAGSNESGLAGSDSGYRGLPAPPAVTASDGTYEDHVHISWSSVTGAASYNVYRGAVQIATGETGNSVDDTPSDYEQYTYTVKPVNTGGGESSFSANDTGYRGLPAPTSVTASDGTFTDKVAITWDAVAGAASYNIYRDSLLATSGLTVLTYDDTAVSDYEQHTYYVHAVKASTGESGVAGSDTGFRGLPAPTLVSASDGTYSDRVVVNWTSVSGAASYNIWRDTTQIGSNETGTSFNDTAVADYAQHTYKVYPVSGGGQAGTLSGQDTGFRGLPSPTTVTATDGTYTDHVKITWSSVAGATSYNVYRTDKTHSVGSVAAGNPLELDDYDSPFSVYNYLVYPVGSGGESALYGSDTGYAGTGLITDLEASDGTFATRIRLTWSQVPGADEYRIFRSTSAGASTQIATVGDVDLYDDTSPALISGTPYYYRVRAYNTGTSELSGYSNEDTGYRAENNWQTPHIVDNTTLSSFLYTDMTVIGGQPMISYWDAGNPSLEFARATTGLPGSGANWSYHTVDSSGAAAVGKFGTSITEVNGHPAIAYCNDTAGTLKYAYANSATPSSSSDWTVMTLEVGSVGNYPSLAVIGGYPAIVYHAQGANQLKFIQANVATPLSAADWGAPYTLDTEAGSGEYGTSLIELGGRAAAAYHVSGSGKLKFARAAVATPANSGQWLLGTVETGGLGQWPALASIGGVPVVAYVDNTNLELRYAYASDTEGSSWTPTLVDEHNRAGAYGLSIVVYGGVPVIAYHESVSADLLIATATSGSPVGPGSWDVVAADEDNCGDYPALALLSDGNPGVAYGAQTTALRFTRFVP